MFTDLDFEFSAGSTVLLGPNGAGKSTLLGLAASRYRPSSGTVTFKGLDPAHRKHRSSFRKLVGWMPQHIQPVSGLTVREQVSYAGWLKGMSRSEAWRRSLEALAAVALRPMADRRASQLSGGQLRRLGLAQTLVHDAEVILLDEPTAGLDPRQRERFREILGALRGEQHVIVSTHQTEDLTAMYQSVVVLDAGKVRYSGTTAGFLALAGAGTTQPVEDAYSRVVTSEA